MIWPRLPDGRQRAVSSWMSLQAGESGTASLRGNQIVDGDSLLAMQVNGADLSLDHGYPARVIVPNNPGVHNIKWVARMSFAA